MTVRDGIKNIRDYERFLRSRGFSRKEAVILAKAYKDLEIKAGGSEGSVSAPQVLHSRASIGAA